MPVSAPTHRCGKVCIHTSDCALHNGPALPAQPCSCRARHCCEIACGEKATFELWTPPDPHDTTDACTAHVGYLISDASETHVFPIYPEAGHAG